MGKFLESPFLVWDPTEKQLEAIEVLAKTSRFLLADVTGLGKTYAALSAYAHLKKDTPSLHMLVFGTKSSCVSWRNDLKKGTNFSFEEFGSHNKEQNELAGHSHDVTLITYSALFAFPELIVRLFNNHPIVLVLDEAHRVKSPKTKTRKVFENLSPYCRVMWMLTATPVTNHLVDLFWMVDLLVPGYFGKYWDFLDAYTVRKDQFFRVLPGQKCGGPGIVYLRSRGGGAAVPHRKVREIVGYKNLPQLSERLDPILLRREHTLEIEFIKIDITLTPEEECQYLVASAGCLGGTFKSFAARLPDLQLAVNNAVDPLRGPNVDCGSLSTKEWGVIGLLADTLHRGEPLVVFTSSIPTKKRLVRIIESRLEGKYRNLYEIDGSSSRKHRENITTVFGPMDVLIITQAGGESLNLQASGKIVFYDLPFDLKVFVQAIGRVARMNTEHEKIYVYIMEAVGTIDTYKSHTIMSNADTFRTILRGASTLPPSLRKVSKDQLKSLRKDLLWRTKKIRKG